MGTQRGCCAQVIPKLESPFFEEASQGKWPEAALFAFTFQPVRVNAVVLQQLWQRQLHRLPF